MVSKLKDDVALLGISIIMGSGRKSLSGCESLSGSLLGGTFQSASSGSTSIWDFSGGSAWGSFSSTYELSSTGEKEEGEDGVAPNSMGSENVTVGVCAGVDSKSERVVSAIFLKKYDIYESRETKKYIFNKFNNF